jgi:hypothetical protein
MNLHANAALSLNKRRDLCQRVVREGWTLTSTGWSRRLWRWSVLRRSPNR